MTQITDDKILEMCRNPESRNYGFNLLVRKYQKQVYYQIRRMVMDHDDANDLVQETFIKVWKKLDQFRGESKLYTWIYRIATNETLSFLNKKQKKFMLPIFDYTNQLAKNLEDDNYLYR